MLKGKRILAIIPARGGSKGVPGKNLRLINGQSLIAHTIDCAKASRYIDRIIVSSEDEHILAEAYKKDKEMPFIRPPHLALDTTPTSDVIEHALEVFNDYDFFVLLQVTSPLRSTTDIDNAIAKCLQQEAISCVSVCIADVSPHWMFKLSKDDHLEPLLNEPLPIQRQQVPLCYKLNGAIYVASSRWFSAHKQLIASDSIAYVMPSERSLDIDHESDFALLHFYLSQQAIREKIC